MSITPQQILNGAYGKSKKNQPGRIANEGVELLGEVNRAIRSFFFIGARVNPFYFMETATVVYSSGWARPTAAEAVYRIEFDSSGDQVIVVPLSDKEAETAEPAIYRLGQTYFGAGNTLDPTNEDLKFYYSRVPTDAPDLSPGTIDTMFPDSFLELPVLEIAIYLAIKDGRDEDLAGLGPQRDQWLRLFLAHLEHETIPVRERWGPPEPWNTSSIIPIGSLLNGPTTVEI